MECSTGFRLADLLGTVENFDSGTFYRVSFDGWATGWGSSNSPTYNYNEYDFHEGWDVQHNDSYSYFHYWSDDDKYNDYSSDTNISASYNYDASWSWNRNGEKSYLIANHVTGYSSSDSHSYYDNSESYHYNDNDGYYGDFSDGDSDSDTKFYTSFDYNESIAYTGWSAQGGLATLPSSFNVHWSPFSGSIYEYDDTYSFYRDVYFTAPNFAVSMYEATYHTAEYQDYYEYNDVYHYGYYSYYDYSYYVYSGYAPTSHVPGNSLPSTPSGSYGNISYTTPSLNYNGNPNFNNYTYVDPQAILDEKYPKPPEPNIPEPAAPPTLDMSGVSPPINDSTLWAITKAVGNSLKNGVVNLAKGGYNTGKELVFTIVDIGAVSADTVATFVGHPIGWEEWSAQGKSYKNSTGLDIATNAARAGLAGGTLGASEIVIGAVNYVQDGDADSFQQHLGGVVTANLAAAGIIKLGQVVKGNKGTFIDQMSPEEAARYQNYWSRYAPENVTPGIRRLDFLRRSERTGRFEESRVIYDEFGRQKYRIDFTDHMRPSDHSNPHLHEYRFNAAPFNPPVQEILYLLD